MRWHEIGRYQIVEYHQPVGNSPGEYADKPEFHIYVDEVDQRTGSASLESALVIAIALGRLEVNHARYMATACLKVLGLHGA